MYTYFSSVLFVSSLSATASFAEGATSNPSIVEGAWLGLGVLSLGMTCLWLWSLLKKDASVVDRVWGLSFVLLAVVYVWSAKVFNWQSGLLLLLVAIWGLRLSLHIFLRNRHHGEDYRYAAMRAHHGRRFWWYSLFSVFLLQAVLAWLISAPLLWFLFHSGDVAFGAAQMSGLVIWSIGFFFETVGDAQLKRFKANRQNAGKLLNTGLWSITRHPNYFGDALLWWGYWSFALSIPMGWVTFFGPLIMTLLIRYVSGVALLEKSMNTSKPGYTAYVASTPPFIPRLHTMSLVRMALFLLLKILTRIFYRFEVREIGTKSPQAWKNVRLLVLLNHTSLFEPIFVGILPLRYIWQLSAHGVFPIAESTARRPVVGAILNLLTPKVGILSRKRDDSWYEFVNCLKRKDTLIFMPEGRMKRADGLDKDGQPMTVRGGIVDVLSAMKTGRMVLAYSGGLHHVQTPGQGMPKLFKTIKVTFEFTTIEDYLRNFDEISDVRRARLAMIADLELRRDSYC